MTTTDQPLELSIRFGSPTSQADDAPLTVSVHVPGLGLASDPFDFAIPLDDKVLDELRWYLELYPQWPVGPDYERALGIEAKLREWGRRLFDAAFAHREALRVYDEFRRAEASGHLVTLDATDARVLRLPWELLADEGGYLFTQKPPVGVRRRLQKAKAARTPSFALPVRILMVISRPDDVGFLDPRSSAEALLDAVEPLGSRVVVEFLYPPTLQALTRRVRDPKQPPVHVVHFDGHGVYVPQTGLGYLLFENDEHKEHLVNADDLGTLLNDTGVPLMVLDACQTAQSDQANPFGSVAARLIESGIGSVLAMNYSVYVEATRILTSAFYGALAEGATLGQAVDAARFAMLMDTERLTLYREGKEEIIHLRDWFLPALYQQAGDPVAFALSPTPLPVGEGPGARVPAYPARGGFPPEPGHGFYGREKELLHLRRTLVECAIVVLHGYGGQGKTALSAHAARWFTRTGLFERAIFIPFERGGGLEYALAEMGAALVGDDFPIHQGDPVEAIADALRQTATLVVWDNFESVLRGGDAPLPDAEMQKLLDAAASWFAAPTPGPSPVRSGQERGVSRLIITTRDPSLPHSALEPGRQTAHTELPGLGLADALELAAQILKDRGIPRPPREELARLLDFLGGHPLSIQLVVPHLRDITPEKLVGEFDMLLPGFTSGAGQERNESLRVSLDFSLRRLGEDTRRLLPALAVFQGRAMEDDLLDITQFPPEAWAQARAELTRAGLVTLEKLPNVQFPCIHFHPTLLPYFASQLGADKRRELEERYCQRYHAVANYLYQKDNTDPMLARTIVVRELPNLRRALDLMLAAAATAAPPPSPDLSGRFAGGRGDEGGLDAAAELSTCIARFLDVFGRWSERDAMQAQVERALAVISKQQSVTSGQSTVVGVSQAEFMTLFNRGEQLLQAGRAAQAERVFRDLLTKLGDAPSYERAVTLARLGRSLRAQGQPGTAADMCRQALVVLAQLEQSDGVKRETGVAHTDLADVLTDAGQYGEARQEYEAALEIDRELGDERGAAVDLGQLGTLALRQNDLAEARKRYLEALATFRAMGESQSEAVLWHQLGRVAQEAKDWAEAERCYKESLAIKERIGDKAGAAQTCNHLANVAQGAGRPDEAERWYLRAIEVGNELDDRQGLAKRYTNLASLLFAQGRLDEAQAYAHRAREIDETLDLSSGPWKDYSILAQIADERGRADEARQWRRKAEETYVAFVDRSGGQADENVRQWEPVIQAVVAACNGNAQAAQEQEPFLHKMANTDDWRNLVAVIRRILAGERGIELTDGLDYTDVAIVRRILDMVPLRNLLSASYLEHRMISLGELVAAVSAVYHGDQTLRPVVTEYVYALTNDIQVSNEITNLAKVLRNVLEGTWDPNMMSQLPTTLAHEISQAFDSGRRQTPSEISLPVPILHHKAADDMLAEAANLYQRAQWKQAREKYEQALDLFLREQNTTGCRRALLGIGTIERRRRNYKDALGFYMQAERIARDSNDLEGIVDVHTHIFQVTKPTDDFVPLPTDYHKSIDLLQTAKNNLTDKDPLYFSVLLKLSKLLFYEGRNEEALVELASLLKSPHCSESDRVNAIYQRAMILEAQKKHQSAAEEFSKCLGLLGQFGAQDDLVQASLGVARCLAAQGNLPDSLQVLQQSMDFSSGIEDPFVSADILMEKGDLFEQAASQSCGEELAHRAYSGGVYAYTLATENLQPYPDTSLSHADVLKAHETVLADAQNAFEALESRAPGERSVHVWRLALLHTLSYPLHPMEILLRNLWKLAMFLENMASRAQVSENSQRCYNDAAKIFGQIRTQLSALKTLVAETDKLKTELTHRIGLITARVGNEQLAIVELESAYQDYKVLKDKRGLAAVALELGSLYQRINLYEKSLPKYNTALNMYKNIKDPRGCAMAQYQIGRLLLQLNDPKKGIEYLKAAREYFMDSKETEGAVAEIDRLAEVTDTYLQQRQSLLNTWHSIFPESTLTA